DDDHHVVDAGDLDPQALLGDPWIAGQRVLDVPDQVVGRQGRVEGHRPPGPSGEGRPVPGATPPGATPPGTVPPRAMLPSKVANSSWTTHAGTGKSLDWAYSSRDSTRRMPRRARRIR